MDRINKVIQKIPTKESDKIGEVIERLTKGDLNNLEIKKLRGHDSIYRVRVGKYRIIYKTGREIKLLEISKRNDSTYSNY